MSSDFESDRFWHSKLLESDFELWTSLFGIAYHLSLQFLSDHNIYVRKSCLTPKHILMTKKTTSMFVAVNAVVKNDFIAVSKPFLNISY